MTDFTYRHIGPSESDCAAMLQELGYDSLNALTDAVIPESLRSATELDLPDALSETAALIELRELASKNDTRRHCIGQGYYGTHTPAVIQRTIFENPAWYTAYTPYQPEISQGRLEALLNFQTLISDLTALPVANASLLDEATAAAEAATMCHNALRGKRDTLLLSDQLHPQTLAVLQTRAEPLGWNVVTGPVFDLNADADTFAVVVSYPDTTGHIADISQLAKQAHEAGALVVAVTDLLALTLLKAPGELGADVAVGSAQRFGVPMGFGGPHAAFIATTNAHKRLLPGRLVGLTRDVAGSPALRLALQTREQHIRRDKATSNICTAQVLLAVMAGMYAVYHGPEGLKAIALRVHRMAAELASALICAGVELGSMNFFDTLYIRSTKEQAETIAKRATSAGYNLRYYPEGDVGISLDETTTTNDLLALLHIVCGTEHMPDSCRASDIQLGGLNRESTFLDNAVFHNYRTETEFMRYVRRLELKDLTLANAMIPLGSCTMKLNAASELLPVSWPEFSSLHPYAPAEQSVGYDILSSDLERWLAEITGFDRVSLQPNAGSAGEYAGLLAIRGYHRGQGNEGRTICLIPESAHGTNPASAVMAGFKVIPVRCVNGGIDAEDLRAKAEQHAAQLGALMLTYPSTYGVFEDGVREVCETIHEFGGQVYLDGANMNAMVGVCRPGDFGVDVCHLNLHKTFCIPHGGGGPGVGPIGVASHLTPYLPANPIATEPSPGKPVAAANLGSASILPISWMYLRMMGASGLRKATQIAILNANYIVHRLREHFDILYTGNAGLVAHEAILDTRPLKKSAGIEVDDIAKRLMDYGFHAPTMSWPVAGTLMIEPTESESKAELDRFCDAMIAIRAEIAEIENGSADTTDNALKGAPHTISALTADDWQRPYSRSQAAWPEALSREYKFWPPVARVDHVYGDRNLVCTCPGVNAFAAVEA